MMNVLREGDWEAQASCRGAETEQFFRGKSDVDKSIKKLCRQCPVKPECLEAAMAEERGSKRRFGYRGGMSAQQRKSLYAKRAKAQRERRTNTESTYS